MKVAVRFRVPVFVRIADGTHKTFKLRQLYRRDPVRSQQSRFGFKCLSCFGYPAVIDLSQQKEQVQRIRKISADVTAM